LFWNNVWGRTSDLTLHHPFFDNDVYEFMMRLGPPGNGKVYIREVAGEMLPPWSAQSPKIHQTIPIGHWLRGRLREMLEDCLTPAALGDIFDVRKVVALKDDHLSGAADNGWRLWALISFVAWRRHVLNAPDRLSALTAVPATLVPA
jgi:asparagine synthase (glutamine-hydrolysing)